MKFVYFSTALCLGLISTGPVFARTDQTVPVNGTVSAVMMPNGDVMMEIKLPPAASQAFGRDMRRSHNICVIKTTDTVATNSMVLVCGPGGSAVQ